MHGYVDVEKIRPLCTIDISNTMFLEAYADKEYIYLSYWYAGDYIQLISCDGSLFIKLDKAKKIVGASQAINIGTYDLNLKYRSKLKKIFDINSDFLLKGAYELEFKDKTIYLFTMGFGFEKQLILLGEGL